MTTEAPPCRPGKAHYWVYETHVPGVRMVEFKKKCKICKVKATDAVYKEPHPFRANWHGKKKKPKSDAEMQR